MKLFLTCLLLIFTTSNGLKILGILPFCSNSHFIIGYSIVKTLLDAGHEITTISPYPRKTKMPNYTDIDASSILDNFKKGEIVWNLKKTSKNYNVKLQKIFPMRFFLEILVQ